MEIWNGFNVRAPIMYFGDATALASIDQGDKATTMSFALTDKPFVDDLNAHNQRYILSVDRRRPPASHLQHVAITGSKGISLPKKSLN
jgi:hypothetical protein